jgi:tetratricopeptide (TPR) repeat protein
VTDTERPHAASGQDRPSGGTAARRAARDASRSTAGRPPSSTSTSAGPAPVRTGGARSDVARRRALDPDTLAALEDERDFLLASLADLEREHDAGDVDETDYAELRDDYTARTAAVLRSIDQRQVLAAEGAPRRSWRGIALVTVAVLLFAVVGGVLLARAAGTRGPGEGVTGDIRLSSRDLLVQAGQLTAQGSTALQQGDSDQALDLFRQAIEAYQQVVQLDPTNAEAMASQAWLLHTVALQSTSSQAAELDAVALGLLDDAVAANAEYAPARIFRASLLDGLGRPVEAQADLDLVDPEDVPSFLRGLFDALRERVAAAVAASSGR